MMTGGDCDVVRGLGFVRGIRTVDFRLRVLEALHDLLGLALDACHDQILCLILYLYISHWPWLDLYIYIYIYICIYNIYIYIYIYTLYILFAAFSAQLAASSMAMAMPQLAAILSKAKASSLRPQDTASNADVYVCTFG